MFHIFDKVNLFSLENKKERECVCVCVCLRRYMWD